METEYGSSEQQLIRKSNSRLNKMKWCLLGGGIVIFLLILCSVFLPNGLIQAVNWLGDNRIVSVLRGVGEHKDIQKENLIEMVVGNIGITKGTSQPVVLLKERNGERYLPILIGLAEVNAISVVMEDVKVPRPLTPDLLCTIVDRLGAKIDHVVITDLKNNIFYARVVFNVGQAKMEVDARPSDAIAIAIRVKAPIYVTRELLDEAGATPDKETEKQTIIYYKKLFVCG